MNKIKSLQTLGYKTSRWIKNDKGIEIFVPDDLDSDDWCVNIPKAINWNGELKDFTYYNITFAMVLEIVVKKASSEQLNNYYNYRNLLNKSVNPILNYKEKHGLTYQDLADIAGVTKQRMEQVCKLSTVKDKTIAIFAAHENKSLMDFRSEYS